MAHLLIVELPGGHDVDIVRAALDRGDRFTFLTARLADYQAQPVAAAALGLAYDVIEVPAFDVDAVLPRVLAAHRRLRFDAVLCLVETRLVEAALLAEHLGLPHIRPATARLLRDKTQVRARLAGHGVAERGARGPLIGCDTLSVQGRHRLLGLHVKACFDAPSLAVRCDTFLPEPSQRAAIERHVFALLDALGFDWGATHTELVLASQGPQLVEVHPCLAGGRLARQAGYALHRSLHADLIALHLGAWPEAGPPRPPAQVAVMRWVAAAQAGVIRHFELPRWRDARIRCVEMTRRSGDAVRAPLDDADRLGYVMVTDADAQQAEALAERFVDDVAVVLQPAADGAARRNPTDHHAGRAAG